MTDADFMREALVEARLAAVAGEMPVGCVIARDGEIVARAHNECEARRDATAHAELLAIRRASAAAGDWRPAPCAPGPSCRRGWAGWCTARRTRARAAPAACTASARTRPSPTSAKAKAA